MPVEGILQPPYIMIGQNLRRRAYDGFLVFAYNWYQDMESLDRMAGKGKAAPYTHERLNQMYTFRMARFYIKEIFDYNTASWQLFECCVFRKDIKKSGYALDL